MLGRLVSARIKTAEQALQAGRLDEAFRMASAPDLAAEGRIRKLLSRLGERLFDRAEKHFQAGRHSEALQDLNKAAHALGEQPRISDMMTIVRAAAEQQAAERNDRRQRVVAAQERLAAGSLRAARALLAQAADSDVQAQRLKDDIEQRGGKAAAAFEEARQHLASQHWSAAVARLQAGCSLDPKSPQAAACEKVVVEAILGQARASLQAGQLARGLEELRLLTGVGDGLVAKDEVRLLERQLESAGGALRAARYGLARRALLQLQHVLPKAAWIKSTCSRLKDLDELVTQLHAGPLGQVFGGLQETTPDPPVDSPPAAALDAGVLTRPAPAPEGDSALPQRLLLWVDGAGSYLMIRGRHASLGRAAARQPADIPLISDLSEHHANLQRVDDDYFLLAGREVNVGGRNVRRALLQDGDRIILGRRAKLVFQLPSRKCTSAVLDLHGSARMPNDVRRVILFDRWLSVSRSRQAHIVVPTAEEPLVLLERDGRLWIKPQTAGPEAASREVVLGQPMLIAGVSLVIEPWSRKHDGLHV